MSLLWTYGSSIAVLRLGKHIPPGENTHNNRSSIARQRISKHASLTIESVFYVWPMQSGYKEEFRSWQEHYRAAVQIEESSFEAPACRDMSLGAEELN
jgi:hypothetical protein